MEDKAKQAINEASMEEAVKNVSKSTNGIQLFLNDSPEAKILFNAINQMRLVSGHTWKVFILFAIAERASKDNPDLALAIVDYITRKKGPGRPRKES